MSYKRIIRKWLKPKSIDELAQCLSDCYDCDRIKPSDPDYELKFPIEISCSHTFLSQKLIEDMWAKIAKQKGKKCYIRKPLTVHPAWVGGEVSITLHAHFR